MWFHKGEARSLMSLKRKMKTEETNHRSTAESCSSSVRPNERKNQGSEQECSPSEFRVMAGKLEYLGPPPFNSVKQH